MVTATTRLLGTAISPEYVKSWDIPMAIRELLQNLLDTKREFGASGAARYNKNRCLAELKDDGPGLELRHLALGISEKGADSVGQFGEGLKLALLLFARENRFIEIRSQDFLLTPVIRESEFGTETLFFEVEEMSSSVQGTTVRFRCSREELEEGKRYFPTEFKVSQEYRVTWLLKDKISLPGGRIFVNGSMVANIPDSLFSYHLWGEDAKAISNRDRTIVDMSNLIRLIQDNIIYKDDVPVKWYQSVLEEITEDHSVFEEKISPNYCNELDAAFLKIFGPKALVSNGDSHHNQLAMRLGFMPVYVPNWAWRWALQDGRLPTVQSFIRERPLAELTDEVDMDSLTAEERERLEKSIDLVEKYYSLVRPLKVVETLDFAIAEGVRGAYNRGEDMIYVARDTLSSLESTVRTVLHETVHKATKAKDLSSEFQSAQDDLAAGLLLELSGDRP